MNGSGINVLYLTCNYPSLENPHHVPFITREIAWLRRAGAEKNLTVDVFAFSGGFNPRRYAEAWAKLQKQYRAKRYDVLHAQFGQTGLLTLFPKPAPTVITFHGSDLNGIYDADNRLTQEGLILRRVSQVSAMRADAIILVSEKMARFLPQKRAYHLIPCGLDLDLFAPAPKQEARRILGLDPNKRYVLFAGSKTNPIKRYELAQATVNALDPALNAELLVPEKVAPDDMPRYMQAADVLLLTSTREGSPSVIKEALACNLPFVSTDVGDVRERVISGCIVSADDSPQALARAVQSVLCAEQPFVGRHTVQDLDGLATAHRVISLYESLNMNHRNAGRY
jgi:teichuronic acid biosynthesis glycosyltransferase TuaC